MDKIKISLIEIHKDCLCLQGEDIHLRFWVANKRMKCLDKFDLTKAKVRLQEENKAFDEYMLELVSKELIRKLLRGSKIES